MRVKFGYFKSCLTILRVLALGGLSLVTGCSLPPQVSQVVVPPGTAPSTPVTFQGKVVLPPGVSFSPSSLRAVSVVGSSNVGVDGAFVLETLVGPQVIMFENENGEIVFLGYLFFETAGSVGAAAVPLELQGYTISVVASPKDGNVTTGTAIFDCRNAALAMVEANPIFLGGESIEAVEEIRREIALKTIAHPQFVSLADAISRVLVQDPANLLNSDAHPEIFSMAADIAEDVYNEIVPSTSVVPETIAAPLGNVTKKADYYPYPEDRLDGTFDMVNPCGIYFVLKGIDFDTGAVKEKYKRVILYSRRWEWRRLPPGLQEPTRKNFDLSVGERVSFLMDSGFRNTEPDLTKTGLVINGVKAIVELLSVIYPLLGVIDLDDIIVLYDELANDSGIVDDLKKMLTSWNAPGMDVFGAIKYISIQVAKFLRTRTSHEFSSTWGISRTKIKNWLNRFLGWKIESVEKLGEDATKASKVLNAVITAIKIPGKITFFWYLVKEIMNQDKPLPQYNIQRTDLRNVTFIPVATVSAAPTSGRAPVTVNFAGQGFDEDGYIVRYEWDFDGDGTFDQISPSGNVSYTYTAPGRYKATLKVVDNDGSWNVVTAIITVTEGEVTPTVQVYAGTSWPGLVYKYVGGNQWDVISPELGEAVLSLVKYNGRIYAGTGGIVLLRSGIQKQSHHKPLDVGGAVGRVYRYDGAGNWVLVGDNLDQAVTALIVWNGHLYAGTSYSGAKLYRYEGGSTWRLVLDLGYTGIRSMRVWNGALYLGDYDRDTIWKYDGYNAYIVLDNEGSCIWDFEVYGGDLFASAWLGSLYCSPDGISWDLVFSNNEGRNIWDIEAFQGWLYMGMDWTGVGVQAGQLWRFNGVAADIVWQYPVTYLFEGVISLANAGSFLLIGTGGEASYYGALGQGKVYLYDGTQVRPISGTLGNGIQVLYVVQ